MPSKIPLKVMASLIERKILDPILHYVYIIYLYGKPCYTGITINPKRREEN